MIAKITTLFCLVALAAGVPIPPIGLGYGGVGLGYGGVGIGGVSHIGGLGLSRINGLGIGSVGYGGLGSVGYGGLGVSSIGLGHSAIGYAPGHIGYGSAIAAPAIIPGLAVPKILAPAPVLHKTLISPPIVKAVAPIDPNPQYSFNYGVSDPHTGDNKHAEETLVNGVTHGSYSLTEPDGTVRKVTYTADKINGFNAVVQRLGVAHHTAPIHKVITPAVHAVAPALHTSPILSPAYATGYAGYH